MREVYFIVRVGKIWNYYQIFKSLLCCLKYIIDTIENGHRWDLNPHLISCKPIAFPFKLQTHRLKGEGGFEPPLEGSQSSVHPLHYSPFFIESNESTHLRNQFYL